MDHFAYRPEIDGLRAIAVAAVVLFHAGIGCSGGYVGVDSFFVISGYLITSLIWKDLERGTFSFASFWERRVRRIVPALFAVTIVTFIAGWVLMIPGDFRRLGQGIALQTIGAANIHYWKSSGYFSTASDEKPLLHTWSLAVEEQFYLVVPLVLWGLYRSKTLRSRAVVVGLIAAALLVSVAWSIERTATRPDAAFYLLPSRAWELLLGSLTAFLPPLAALARYRKLRQLLAAAGLALLTWPIFSYDSATRFPGLAALPPCLGTALVIWANTRARSDGDGVASGGTVTWVGALLASRPMVFVGLASYSLYLWHWPWLAFSKYSTIAPLALGPRLVLVGLGVVCGLLSWKFIETPFRERRLGTTRRAMFRHTLAGMGFALGCGVFCLATSGFPQRLTPRLQSLAEARDDVGAFDAESTLAQARSGRFTPLGVLSLDERPDAFVWGDSHAKAALPAIDALFREQGLVGRAAAHSSLPPVLGWWKEMVGGLGDRQPEFNDHVIAYIRREQISDVILVARWGIYLDPAGTTVESAEAASFKRALVATVEQLVAAGSRPWIVLDVPNHSFDVPKALCSPFYSSDEIAQLCSRPAARDELNSSHGDFLAELRAVGARVLDPKPHFLDSTGTRYLVEAEGIALYRDHDHLTAKGAQRILLPFLRESTLLEAARSEPRLRR